MLFAREVLTAISSLGWEFWGSSSEGGIPCLSFQIFCQSSSLSLFVLGGWMNLGLWDRSRPREQSNDKGRPGSLPATL